MSKRVTAPKMTAISDIKCGKIELAVQARVIHLWTVPDKNNPAEDGSIHMLLLDEKCGKIHAAIRKNLIPVFKDDIEEGSAYVIEQFMVGSNDHAYKTTNHKYKLNFMGSTTVFKVSPGNIPASHFSFVPFLEIMSATREDRLLDVIGHVVEKDMIKETEKNGKKSKVMDITLEDLECNRVHCTLWENYAERMQQFLDSHDPSQPLIMILQLCKLKKFFGAMGVSNSFFGTRLLLNADLPDVESYRNRLNETDVALTQVMSQMTGPTVVSLADDMLNTNRMTIEDLIESTEKCFGSVLARTCEIESDLGWYYQACTKCASRVTFAAGGIYCEKCKMPRTAAPRFKVHLQVIDNSGSTTFVLFDRVVTQALGRTVQELLDGNANRNATAAYPTELDTFVDKRMLFKVEVSDANLFRNWRSYAVKKLTGDEEIIQRYLTFHGLNVFNEGEEPLCLAGSNENTENTLLALEGGDSNHKEETSAASETPTSKQLGKRPAETIEGLDSMTIEKGEVSATKEARVIGKEAEDAK